MIHNKIDIPLSQKFKGCSFGQYRAEHGMIAVYTKVFGIIESSFVVPVRKTPRSNLFRDGRRIFTKERRNVFKSRTFG